MPRKYNYTRPARRRQRNSSATAVISQIAFVALIVIGILAFRQCENAHRQAERDKVNTAIQSIGGSPSDALTRVSTAHGLDEQAFTYSAFNGSFNPSLHIPNWVAWELTRDEVKSSVASRKDKTFQRDANVAGCPESRDYSNSGYERGHMCPASDMKWSDQAMTESFTMTNVCPQRHSLNAGVWQTIEQQCRDRAVIDSAIYIVTGPVLSDGIDTYIGRAQVAVPKRFFKVILAPYAREPYAIGFIIDADGITSAANGAMSVDRVEAITGHDFFAALPDDIENQLESNCNYHAWKSKK